MKPLRFQNPANQYVEEINDPVLGVLLFGPIYIGLRGAWVAALGYTVVTVFTVGLFWLVLPFLVTGIFRRHYLSLGWTELKPEPKPERKKWKIRWPKFDGDAVAQDSSRVLLGGMGVLSLIAVAFMAWMKWAL